MENLFKEEPKKESKPKIDLGSYYKDSGKNYDTKGLTSETSEVDLNPLGVKTSDFEDYGNIYKSQDINKTRAQNQSAWEQMGSFAVQSLGEIVGGTIAGVGSIGGIFEAGYDELKGEDADFNNFVIQFGEDIKNSAKDVAPIYRENQGKSWDISDFGWWAENAVSFASTASMLIPSYGATKGLGYLGKLLKITDKVGDTTKYLAKIGTGAIVSRNAENFTESLQVLNDVKSDLSKRFENDEEFEKIKNSEVGKELAAEGREVTKENLTNFIASKAGWQSYKVNSINVVFDALQMASAFKNPMTRKGFFSSTSKEALAEKAILGGEEVVKNSISGRIGDFGKAALRTTYNQLSEGVEEGINYYGTLSGKNLAKELTGQKKDNVDFGQLTESAFWGMFGGLANSAGSSIYKKITGENDSKLNEESSLNEINNRFNFINESVKKINEITNNSKLSDEEKKRDIAIEKQSSIAQMTFQAAANGNVDGVLKMVNNPSFKKKLIENGFESSDNIDKSISKINTEVLQAEKHYKTFVNNFQKQDINGQLKASLILQGSNIAFFQDKLKEKQNTLSNELIELKNNDSFYYESNSDFLENTIQLTSLKTANEVIKNQMKLEKDDYSKSLYKQRIEENLKEIEKIENLSKDTEKVDINKLNPQILEKQTNAVLLNNMFKVNGQYLNEKILNKEEVKKKDTEIKENQKSKEKEIFDSFTKDIQSKINESKLDSNGLKDLIKNEKSPKNKAFLNEELRKLEKQEVVQKEKQEVEEVKENSENKENNLIDEDEILSFSKEYTIGAKKEKVDEKALGDLVKTAIDKGFEDSDIGVIYSGLVNDNPLVKQYTINKILERKDNILKGVEKIQETNIEVSPVNRVFEFNEQSYNQIENKPKKDIELEDDGIDYNIETEVNNNQTAIGIGAWFLFKESNFSKDSDGNIVVKDKIQKSFKALQNLKKGDELAVSIDTKNIKYEENKEDLNNIPLKVTTKDGTFISYLATINGLNKNYISEKEELLKLRKLIGTNPNSKITVKVELKSDGDVVNINKWQSIKKSGLGESKFYALKPGTSDEHLTSLKSIATGEPDLLITTNREGGFGSINKYSSINAVKLKDFIDRKGTVYILLKGLNGKIIPSPVIPSRITSIEAKSLEKNIIQLASELNKSTSTNRDEIKLLIDKISSLIYVDKKIGGEYGNISSLQYFPKTEKKEGRIVLKYFTQTGENAGKERLIIIRSDGFFIKQVESTTVLENGTLKKETSDLKIGDKQFFSFDTKAKGEESTFLQKVLENKFFNLDFKKLGTDEKYIKEVVDSGKILTNVGQVFNENGDSLGNFFGESNSFKLKIKLDNLNEFGLTSDEWASLNEEEKETIVYQKNNC